jgi:squalene-hopene/tetraprenyl-beta-curcumene cyclase
MKGIGESTPSQTAWALIGLLAATDARDPAVRHAIRWLLTRQNDNGSWDESATTGTGFPTVFYLKYHLYRHVFPLYALARYRNVLQGQNPFYGVLVSPQQFERRNGSRVRQ